MAELAQIAETADQKLRVEQYRAWLHTAVASSSEEPCKAYIDHSEPVSCLCARRAHLATLSEGRVCARAVLQSSVPLTISRQLLSAFVQEITALPVDLRKQVATQCALSISWSRCADHVRMPHKATAWSLRQC